MLTQNENGRKKNNNKGVDSVGVLDLIELVITSVVFVATMIAALFFHDTALLWVYSLIT